jgi:antitoxin Phd
MPQVATKPEPTPKVTPTPAARVTRTVTATEAKTRFGPLLEEAMRGETVVITRHNTPKAVLISMAEYQALGGRPALDLSALTAEYEAMVDAMQTPASRKAMRAAFNASPEELARAAVEGARRRG